MGFILCTWFGEFCSCCSLTALPGPAWVLLNGICKELISSLYCTSTGLILRSDLNRSEYRTLPPLSNLQNRAGPYKFQQHMCDVRFAPLFERRNHPPLHIIKGTSWSIISGQWFYRWEGMRPLFLFFSFSGSNRAST